MAQKTLAYKLMEGDRRSLAQAITLMESNRPEDQDIRLSLLEEILPASGRSLRLGISGVPGVGKSTFIETFGLHAIEQGKRVAVLAIDPSSPLSHGSILGDKTRMSLLASNEHAYIRPSPSGGILGGVAKHTRETIVLCEAAGFDLILVETVGVGQLEADVVDLVDLTLLLLSPTGGDMIQGMKKGLLELVDLIVVNKADGPLQGIASQMAKELTQALKLSVRHIKQTVLLCSALEKRGIDQVYTTLDGMQKSLQQSGSFSKAREAQLMTWYWEKVDQCLLETLKKMPQFKEQTEAFLKKVIERKLSPSQAAQEAVLTYLTPLER